MAEQPGMIVVGVGACAVSSEPDSTLVTYALGSCIAVAAHDPVARVGGLLHLMLPESSLDTARAMRNPCLFADTGIPTLLRLVYEAGARKPLVTVKIAGGAQMMVESSPFHIGKRNILAVRKALWCAGALIAAADVGGRESRTVRLEVGSGRFLLSTGCRREEAMERSANGDLCFDRG